jgi:lipopolysaccharide/colanic/teichoic acid biosynthesis glycosyltransferase
MSLVGPRPEVPQHLPLFNQLAPEALSVRPGITGPATLLYRDEERLLAGVDDPESVNASLLLPDKLRLNAAYARGYTLAGDLLCLLQTLAGAGPRYRALEAIPRDPRHDAPHRRAA